MDEDFSFQVTGSIRFVKLIYYFNVGKMAVKSCTQNGRVILLLGLKELILKYLATATSGYNLKEELPLNKLSHVLNA